MNGAVKQLARHGFAAEPVTQNRVQQGLGHQPTVIQRSLRLDGAQSGFELGVHVERGDLHELAGLEREFGHPIGQVAGELLRPPDLALVEGVVAAG